MSAQIIQFPGKSAAATSGDTFARFIAFVEAQHELRTSENWSSKNRELVSLRCGLSLEQMESIWQEELMIRANV